MAVAPPWITLTMCERILAARELASAESISSAVMRVMRERRIPVVSPGTGPTSKTFDPRFTRSNTQGTTSVSSPLRLNLLYRNK
jgi:hypothetical protein